MAYEHVEGVYSEYLENPEVFDSKKILGVPSPMNNTTQFMIGGADPRNLRWIQHIRMPYEPHVQGRVMKGATLLKQHR